MFKGLRGISNNLQKKITVIKFRNRTGGKTVYAPGLGNGF